MKKIYFIEGMPGIGKTTLSLAVENSLLKKAKKVKRYEEHSFENPLDMTRKALLSQTEYKLFVEKCVALAKGSKYSSNDIIAKIEAKTSFEDEYAIISYLQPYFKNEAIVQELRQLYSREICNGHISEKEYMDVIFSMFCKFSKDAQDDWFYVFDGALFQNILLDMIGFYNTSNEVLKIFYNKLLSILASFEIIILYLYDKNVETILNETNSARAKMNWLSEYDTWVTRTNWFQMQEKISGHQNSATAFSYDLQKTMLDLMNSFSGIEKHFIKARYTTLNLKGVI